MHRFFVSELDPVDDVQALICSEDLMHQFTKVLRFAKGEKVVLLNNSGFEFVVELQDFNSKRILGKVLSKKFCETELPMRLVIAQAILKNMERFEWMLQKGTELGVSAFVPLLSDRTERKALGKIERLHRILKEAAEQSGRGKVPELLEEKKFEKIFDDGGEKLFVLPHPGAEQKFSDFCREKLIKDNGEQQRVSERAEKFSGEMLICIGPEGGFTDKELYIAESKGAHLVSLGNRILRAETVAMVMGSIVAGAMGEM
jgi:16S rRNA (uracil1498-N3)-methyltransferase